MLSRQLQILISKTLPLVPDNVLIIGESGIAFSKATNLLGQEFEHILFDGRNGIHLEALAIGAGTLKMGGTLCLVLSDWENLSQQPDQDSLRWNGNQSVIATPNFIDHFKQCIDRYHFPILREKSSVEFPPVFYSNEHHKNATLAQQQIIDNILQVEQDIYFLTAKRGRGKSALLGMLANQIQAPVYLTAPNKSAVYSVIEFSEGGIEFIAPDELALMLQTEPEFSQSAWLLVDEAAMIPLPLLQEYSQYFQHIIFSTTIHSYEGTGRGFELKFKRKIHRTFQHFELKQPLRWQENDPLEDFIDDLLLLNAEDEFQQFLFQPHLPYQIREVQKTHHIAEFYGLMTLAHYRTSPLDLRRLFDGENQRFYFAEYQQNLLGAIWALEEGNMADDELIIQIQQGKRRPKGNLVPQALCFHENLSQACKLHSLRISRIAVQPNWQKKGIGQNLMKFMKNSEVDFFSVSFGYTDELAKFWQKCGFVLVHLGEHQEASSGCYSAIALKGLSKEGLALVDSAYKQFQRNIPLSFHPFAINFEKNQLDWQLDEFDWLSLKNFANFHRTLFSSIPAMRRLLKLAGKENFPLISAYLTKKQLPINKKKGVEWLRLEIKQYLERGTL
ncbi:tRNA(Met) cytidine acetyltransferase [Haemophilus quentini]|uniref:tRNA(Met) cytidine acetyltransferase TmcA n=1 Tax=Haemophilus quentini TaxID=123834 RepID=A0ABX3BPR2_9PAST|nr:MULTISPECIES: GNAT family N-acetyltransferase [Haemophilus]EGT82681.1 tRNAMet cytidine acetyltransferase TmcA [Haemophilus haemolyticus M21639]NYA46913.1 tRNA(Met) cytidine acetyltransferase [Haemophilus haemolyticus]OEY75390.1 tRNA(Met) cytidine acetyltransferase [Haemophilus quentini]OEY77119.1 tRNA(Met) cytidine acetyltransferase [Haemophilus quentini]ORC35764.1 tRNA(Met) cytidine acetyltransferase [Haemophilus quentini]